MRPAYRRQMYVIPQYSRENAILAECGMQTNEAILFPMPTPARRQANVPLTGAFRTVHKASGTGTARGSARFPAMVAAGVTWLALLSLVSTVARAQCPLEWADGYGLPELDNDVLATLVYDDGQGPKLYIGGRFATGGGKTLNRVAAWDGRVWEPLGSGMNNNVQALVVFDDGLGPALYAAGNFTTAGGVSASHIARWDGTSWSPLANGTDDWVFALTVFDDGSGPALYAGGLFGRAGGATASHIARWDGTNWSALGEGVSGPAVTYVKSLAVLDDGAGDALFVGGTFDTAGGKTATLIAKWDGSNWSALGSGLQGFGNPYVAAMTNYDDGNGSAVYVGGRFAFAGGQSVDNLARWDGSAWSNIGGATGTNAPNVASLFVYDSGAGSRLVAGGAFTNLGGTSADHVGEWDGVVWRNMADGLDGLVLSLTTFDAGGGSLLYAAGTFDASNSPDYFARWDGSTWHDANAGLSGSVFALGVFDIGAGPALYVGGFFRTAGDVAADSIVKSDGRNWTALGAGINRSVSALAQFDDGSGTALCVGGNFDSAGGVSAENIARWNGQTWSSLGRGLNSSVVALAVFDDGSGETLYAGGLFSRSEGTIVNAIAKWGGVDWAPVGSGIAGPNRAVRALTVFDEGGGKALYVGGFFIEAGGVPANSIARWNGAEWSSVDGGTDGSVAALVVFDDGNGPALHVGGFFSNAGATPALNIAKWDGSTWSPLGSGLNGGIRALAVFDDGSGPALYASGNFTDAGGVSVRGVAKWDGTSWSDVGGGVWASTPPRFAQAMTKFDDGAGDALYVGGTFTTAGTRPSFGIARWSRVGPTICDHPDSMNRLIGATASLHVAASGTGSLGFQWRKNGVNLADDGRISGTQTDTLTIQLVVSEDSGEYDVIVRDDCFATRSNGAWLAVWPLGDLNCDGRLDGADIDPFFLALGDPAAYATQFPNCDPQNGDINGDGRLDGGDIDPFFQCLGGGCP